MEMCWDVPRAKLLSDVILFAFLGGAAEKNLFCIYTEGRPSSRIHNAPTPQNTPNTFNDFSPYLF